MEIHQLSSMMIGGLSLLAVLAWIVPVWADLEDDKKEICSYYHGEWEDGNCNLENENLRDEYNDDVAYAEDSYAIDRKQEEQDATLAFASSDKDDDKGYVNADEEMKIDNSGLLIKSKDYKSQEKEICKNHDGEWLINANECKFDDNGDHDSVDFDHTMEEKGLWDDYVADKRPYNPNDVDSDNDGTYDDEELSEEEEKRLAESNKDDADDQKDKKEKTKELYLENDGVYDGKCEFNDKDAEQDQVDFEHALADRGLLEEYDKNYNGADWEYDEADA